MVRVSNIGKCKKGKFKGEKCLLAKSSKYPVTRGGKLSCMKVKRLMRTSRSKRTRLKSKGLYSLAKKCHVNVPSKKRR